MGEAQAVTLSALERVIVPDRQIAHITVIHALNGPPECYLRRRSHSTLSLNDWRARFLNGTRPPSAADDLRLCGGRYWD
jgi:hypothetical protein